MRHPAVACALVALALTGCVEHPVSPARTFGTYEGKAATTTAAALSAVQTARLAVRASRTGSLPTYVSLTLGEAEGSVSGVAGTFASIQPPGRRADALRRELLGLLSDAQDHLGALRIAARRGRRGDDLARLAEPLARDAARLRRFGEAHR